MPRKSPVKYRTFEHATGKHTTFTTTDSARQHAQAQADQTGQPVEVQGLEPATWWLWETAYPVDWVEPDELDDPIDYVPTITSPPVILEEVPA
jgi:hypothetical protein